MSADDTEIPRNNIIFSYHAIVRAIFVVWRDDEITRFQKRYFPYQK